MDPAQVIALRAGGAPNEENTIFYRCGSKVCLPYARIMNIVLIQGNTG